MTENSLKPQEEFDLDTLCGAMEAVIFMSDRPINLDKIKQLIGPDIQDIPQETLSKALERLREEYQKGHRGIHLVEIAGGYQLRTKASFSSYIQDLPSKGPKLVLTPTALEVLAIIAYRHPVSKASIDKIRGVDSGHIIRGLMDKRLVKTCGRSSEMGRPMLYETTPEFLEVFNLASIDDLPSEHELESLLETGEEKVTNIQTLISNGDKERFVFNEIDELDQLAKSIKTISTDTSFTASLKSEEKKRQEGMEEACSPFDLLEKHLSWQAITETNQKARNSELLTEVIEPQIVGDLTTGPFNVPSLPLDDEEFQMIDLDTGLPLKEEISSPELEWEQSHLEEAVKNLDQKTSHIKDQAKDLGLNLEFIKDSKVSTPSDGELN